VKLTIVNRSKSEISKPFVKSWVLKLSSHVPELSGYSQLVLAFVSSKEMRALNKKYRGKDYATDVLSFEPVDFESFSPEPVSKPRGSKPRKTSKARPLGELVFCLSVIKRQAKVHDLTFDQELGYMIIHGILHLLGYEHENSPTEAKKMFKLQDQTFAKLIK
jgi:probable rRNA maturation factor